MESNPFRVIPLLSISSPCRGIIFFRYRERSRGRLILETDFEESRVLALMVFGIHVLGFYILIYIVLREILITLELLEYSCDICFYEYWFMSPIGIFTQVWVS